MSKSAFDSVAEGYDEAFTHTDTGSLQRERVYYFVNKLLKKERIQTVLELNCGTGEDALWLAQRGCQVLATDISANMIAVAREKSKSLPAQYTGKVAFQTLKAEEIDTLSKDQTFDMIFSNFGGLNCLSPEQLTAVSEGAWQQLKPGGLLVAIVMGRHCLWEIFYFLLKRQWNKAWRRRSKEAIAASLSPEVNILTWYYSPQEFYHLFSGRFEFLNSHPIGLALPPSYLDPSFHSRPGWLKGLKKAEKWLGEKEKWADYADHFLIVLRKV